MTDSNGSGQNTRPSTMPKAIGSLAKKQDDVTRQGTQKMKFAPTLPIRRKKTEEEIKKEEISVALPSSSSPRGRDRGRGRGRGRGVDGRGEAPRPTAEMVASGPFALGPAMAGSSSRRSVPRSNFTPVVPFGSSSSSLDAGLTRTAPPALKDDPGMKILAEDEAEVYSDQEDGVEIVDIQEIKRMDWMAPETLQKEALKKVKNIKKETISSSKTKNKGNVRTFVPMDIDAEEQPEKERVNAANALDLSESEDEDDIEGLLNDFGLQDQQADEESGVRAEKLYFFQFPSSFPQFRSPTATSSQVQELDATTVNEMNDQGKKKVTFAEDAKSLAVPGADEVTVPEEDLKKVDGVIGRLEIYQSGAVKMRLNNGLVLDIAAATQPSFLQHAVHLDSKNKRLSIIGEVNRRFVAFPEIDTMLSKWESLEQEETTKSKWQDNDVLKMSID